MNPVAKGILTSKTFWTAFVAAAVAIGYMVVNGEASKEGIVGAVMSVVMVVLRLVTSGPVHVRKPKSHKAVVGLLLLGGMLSTGCIITPAIQAGAQVTSCRLDRYTVKDPLLDENQKAERLDLSENHRKLLRLPEACPEVGR
jgi:hypothetical protein